MLATRMGDRETIMWLLNQGTNPNLALIESAKMDNVDLINYFISIGATSIDDAVRIAAENGKIVATTHLLNMGASKDQALYGAGKGSQDETIGVLVEIFESDQSITESQTRELFLALLIGVVDGKHIALLRGIYSGIASLIDATQLLSRIDQSTSIGQEMANVIRDRA